MAKKLVFGTGFAFNKATNEISVSEKIAGFAIQYELLNPATNCTQLFDFSHSTGPEFDPGTKWVYTCADIPGLTLAVYNDAEMAERAAANYLAGKLGK